VTWCSSWVIGNREPRRPRRLALFIPWVPSGQRTGTNRPAAGKLLRKNYQHLAEATPHAKDRKSDWLSSKRSAAEGLGSPSPPTTRYLHSIVSFAHPPATFVKRRGVCSARSKPAHSQHRSSSFCNTYITTAVSNQTTNRGLDFKIFFLYPSTYE